MILKPSVFLGKSFGTVISLHELFFLDIGGALFRRFEILLIRLESGKLFLVSSIPLSSSIMRCTLSPGSFLVNEFLTKRQMVRIIITTNKTLPIAIRSCVHVRSSSATDRKINVLSSVYV